MAQVGDCISISPTKDGYRAAACSELYSSECRKIAEEAADMMALQEKQAIEP